jgi:hypothetical protein
MAISLVTLLDTFLTWMNKTNETITVANLATEGQLNTSGTITITNAGGVGGGVSLNVASGLIKGDGGLLTNVLSTGSVTNAKLANDNIRFVSNTTSLTIITAGATGRANLGTTVYVTLPVSNVVSDTSTTNIAAANTINTVHSLAIAAFAAANSGTSAAAAYDKANAANVLAFNANLTAIAAFAAANSGTSAAAAYDKANAANVLAFNANLTAIAAYTAANSVTGGGYYKGNRGTIGTSNNAGDIFRVNYQYLTANVTIDATDRAVAVGPLTVNTGFVLTISSGGRAVII